MKFLFLLFSCELNFFCLRAYYRLDGDRGNKIYCE